MRVIAMSRSFKRSGCGFTLVETIVTIVILAIALSGVASLVSLGTSSSADTLLETRAIALGESYLDEIQGRRFDERSAASGLDPCYTLAGPDRCSTTLGPDGGESTRDRYDDVDDYHGMEEGDGVVGFPIEDAEGNTRPGYDNFHVEVDVSYAGGDIGMGVDQTNAKLITVTVTTGIQTDGWEFSVYKANY